MRLISLIKSIRLDAATLSKRYFIDVATKKGIMNMSLVDDDILDSEKTLTMSH